jgi:hypothetical protein
LKPTTKGQDQIPAENGVSIFHIRGPSNRYKQSKRYYQLIVIVFERRKHNHNHALDPARLISYWSDLPYMFKMCIQGPLNRYKHRKSYYQLTVIVIDKRRKYNHNHALDPTRLISFWSDLPYMFKMWSPASRSVILR